MTLLGRPYQPGDLEYYVGRGFSDDDRADAARAFEALKRDGHIQPRDCFSPLNPLAPRAGQIVWM